MGPQLTILLIEDNSGDARLIRELLLEDQPHQFHVTVVDRLSVGLERLATSRFDAVLLDLSLPDSQGLATLRAALEVSPETPVVVLTGLDDDETGLEAVQQGAEDYLVKGSVDSRLLLRAIRYAIERRRAEQNLRESQQFLQSTLNALPAHIAILDETGTITEVNNAWRHFADANGLGDPAYGVGANYLAICEKAARDGDSYAAAAASGIRKIQNGQGNGFYLEYPCHSPDEQRWFMMRLKHFTLGGSLRVIVTHHNITERVLIEHAERDQRQMAEVLSQTSALVNQTLKLDDVLDAIVSNVERVVPNDAAYILQVEGANARTAWARGFERYGVDRGMASRVVPIGNLHDLRWMVENQRPIVIPNVLKERRWYALPETAWARSFAAAPILTEGQVTGFLCVLSGKPGFFTQTHADRLQGLANQAATALRNAQLYQELAQYSSYLEDAVAIRTAELQESEARFRQLAEHIREVFWITNADSTQVEYVSPAYEEIWGRPRETLYQNPFEWMAAIHPDDRARVEQEALDKLSGTYDTEYRITLPGGAMRWIRDRGYPVHDDQGNAYRIIGFAEDITESKRSTVALQQALARELEINEMRSRYVSMASHDLRTPLAVLQSGLEILEHYSDQLSAEKRQSKFTQLKLTIRGMLDLLDDILIVGRTEANSLKLKLETVDIHAFCLNVLNDIQSSIGTDHRFDFSPNGICGSVRLDPKLFRHALTNLLSNAVKYSPPSTTVSVRLLCVDQNIRIRVQDQGIGIPRDEIQHLFEPFWRASNARVTQGTGLGLVIVKQSVELHGGTIRVESMEGAGTTFTITIPLVRPD